MGEPTSTMPGRRLGRARGRSSVVTAASAAALLGAAAVLLALSVLVAVLGGEPGVGTAAGAEKPAPAHAPGTAPSGSPGSPGGEQLYRVVGCRSTGTAAHREGPHRKEVAFGFDDGPWTDTPAFVEMLERARARATFFMIGRQIVPGDRSLFLRELRDGDVLGDHTFTHPDLTLSHEVRGQLERTIAVIRALSGYTPCVFRPPYGDYDPSVLRTARALGLSTVLWNVDPADYTLPGSRAIEQRVLAQVQPGSIVISHDGGGPRGETLAAYPGIIARLRARGYRIVTVLELLGYAPIYEPCIKLCDGIGVPRRQVPRGAIIRRAP